MIVQNEMSVVSENTVRTHNGVTEFFNQPIHRQAKVDFKYLCAQSNFNTRDYLQFVRIEKIETLGDFIVLGVMSNAKTVTFPKTLIDPSVDSQFIMLFTYISEGKVDEVYVFSATEFAGKHGLFAMFKQDKVGNYVIKLKAKDKMKPYLYGTVMNDLVAKKTR